MHDSSAKPGYEELYNVLMEALTQAQTGKGKQRHAMTGDSFNNQSICVIQSLVGEGYALGQAIKKILESKQLNVDAAIAERLGAINYLAASIIHLRKTTDPGDVEEDYHSRVDEIVDTHENQCI